jgi:hypothetical protein
MFARVYESDCSSADHNLATEIDEVAEQRRLLHGLLSIYVDLCSRSERLPPRNSRLKLSIAAKPVVRGSRQHSRVKRVLGPGIVIDIHTFYPCLSVLGRVHLMNE